MHKKMPRNATKTGKSFLHTRKRPVFAHDHRVSVDASGCSRNVYEAHAKDMLFQNLLITWKIATKV